MYPLLPCPQVVYIYEKRHCRVAPGTLGVFDKVGVWEDGGVHYRCGVWEDGGGHYRCGVWEDGGVCYM